MLRLRMRRGTPCDVRPGPTSNWRPHVCSTDSTFLFADRVPYCDTLHWVFERERWQVRVAVPFLERGESVEDDGGWYVGVTGTREGLTARQRAALVKHFREWLICSLHVPTFHHGGCAGADRHVHNAVREVWGKVARIVVHPASDQPEALCDWSDADEVRDPFPSLIRNRHIVDAITDGAMLLGCPKGMKEEQRSGTWSTIRTARKLSKSVLLFYPDGSIV